MTKLQALETSAAPKVLGPDSLLDTLALPESAMLDLAPPGSQIEPHSRVEVAVCSTLAELETLAPDWLRLEQLSHPAALFQSHGQIRHWARHHAGTSRLHVIVVRQNGRAVMILPLAIRRSRLLRVAHMAGDPVAQYSDIIIAPPLATPALFELTLADLARSADVVVFRRVRDDSHLLRLGRFPEDTAGNRQSAPWADLSTFADYDAYLGSLSKNMRKGLRNRQHHLRDAGRVSFEIFAGGPEARAAVEEAFDLKREWLVQRGALSSAFADSATCGLLADLAEDHAGTGSVVMRLLIDDVPAAIRFGFERQAAYFAYLGAYRQRFASLSPGKMLMAYYLAEFRKRNIQRLDMLAPTDLHKTDWCANETGVADYMLPLNALGWAHAGLYEKRLRPALRSAWVRLPQSVRSRLAASLVKI